MEIRINSGPSMGGQSTCTILKKKLKKNVTFNKRPVYIPVKNAVKKCAKAEPIFYFTEKRINRK